MKKLQNTNKIGLIKDPFSWSDEKSEIFVKACEELAYFHYDNCSDIRKLYDKYSFNPSSIKSEEDIVGIPHLGVTAMKYYLIKSMPDEKSKLVLTSSGTKGQKTQIWLDEKSLDRAQGMLRRVWEQEKIVSNNKTNYILFTYNPDQMKNYGVAWSLRNEHQFAPVNDEYFTLNLKNGEWIFDKNETIEKLKEFEESNLPIRISGMPAFIYAMLEVLKEKNIKVKFGPESYLFTGGGWKKDEDKAISFEEFIFLVETYLGISKENIRDNYGMAEHCAPYIHCKKHRFHVPASARVYILNPVTLEKVPDGQIGLMKLVTPFNTMMPNLSILTTDLALINREKCGCGYNSPTFKLMGRGGLNKHKGCALNAAEIVKREA